MNKIIIIILSWSVSRDADEEVYNIIIISFIRRVAVAGLVREERAMEGEEEKSSLVKIFPERFCIIRTDRLPIRHYTCWRCNKRT